MNVGSISALTIIELVMKTKRFRGKTFDVWAVFEVKTEIPPESSFMTRDNKPQGFFYLNLRTVDGLHGIIVDIHAAADNINDSQPYIAQLEHT